MFRQKNARRIVRNSEHANTCFMHHENKKKVLIKLHFPNYIGNINQAYTVAGARRKMRRCNKILMGCPFGYV